MTKIDTIHSIMKIEKSNLNAVSLTSGPTCHLPALALTTATHALTGEFLPPVRPTVTVKAPPRPLHYYASTSGKNKTQH